jgi:hypothetical protein
MGNRGVAPYVLIFGTRWNGAVTVTLWLFYAEGYGLQYPLDRQRVGHRACLDNFREEKKSVAPAGNENFDSLLTESIAL